MNAVAVLKIKARIGIPAETEAEETIGTPKDPCSAAMADGGMAPTIWPCAFVGTATTIGSIMTVANAMVSMAGTAPCVTTSLSRSFL